jgi:hypothetical protein
MPGLQPAFYATHEAIHGTTPHLPPPTHTHCPLSMQATQPEAPLQPTSPPPPLLGLPPLTISNHHLMAKVFGLSQMAPHLASSTAFHEQLDRFL